MMMIITLCGGTSLAVPKKVKIVTTPDDKIIHVLTPSLKIACSLVPASSKDDPKKKANFTKITSVTINQKRSGKYEHIASLILDKDKPTLFSPFDDDAIKTSQNLATGFLELTVPKPQEKHTGTLQCVVRGNKKDIFGKIEAEVEVGYEEPSLPNMAKYIYDLEKQLHSEDKQLQGDVKRLDKEDKRLDTEDKQLQGDVKRLDKEDKRLDKKDKQLQENVQRVEDEMSAGYVAKSDIQQGDFNWFPTPQKFHETGDRILKHINFPHRYNKAPKVFVAVRYIFGNGHIVDWDSNTGSEYGLGVWSVTTTGFDLECKVYKFSYVNWMRVVWIAFPSP